jgi:signal peptidase I
VIQELAGLLILGLSPLWVTFILSQFVSAYVIPSHSMEGTLMVGDVVLADKVSPKLHLPLERGDIIFFRPPEELSKIVAHTRGRIGARDLFVKRVAGIAGDSIRLDDETGGQSILIDGSPYAPPALVCPSDIPAAQGDMEQVSAGVPAREELDRGVAERLQALQAKGRISSAEAAALLRDVTQPQTTHEVVESVLDRAAARISNYPFQEQLLLGSSIVDHTHTISEHEVFVLGDCARASTDSRSWGDLPESLVVARPFLRVWPPNRMGTIEKTADLNPFRRSLVQFRREDVAKMPILH